LNLQLVVTQLNGEYEIKDNAMAAYVHRVRKVVSLLKYLLITHMLRFENFQPDGLYNLASLLQDEKPKRI